MFLNDHFHASSVTLSNRPYSKFATMFYIRGRWGGGVFNLFHTNNNFQHNIHNKIQTKFLYSKIRSTHMFDTDYAISLTIFYSHRFAIILQLFLFLFAYCTCNFMEELFLRMDKGEQGTIAF